MIATGMVTAKNASVDVSLRFTCSGGAMSRGLVGSVLGVGLLAGAAACGSGEVRISGQGIADPDAAIKAVQAKFTEDTNAEVQ